MEPNKENTQQNNLDNTNALEDQANQTNNDNSQNTSSIAPAQQDSNDVVTSDINADYAFANNDFKRVKLLNIFDKLKSYIKILISSLNDIEQDKLTTMQLIQISAIQKELSTLFDNINFYICNVYSLKEYNDNLYSYLLYNKQLADATSKLRNVLHLVSDNKTNDKK